MKLLKLFSIGVIALTLAACSGSCMDCEYEYPQQRYAPAPQAQYQPAPAQYQPAPQQNPCYQQNSGCGQGQTYSTRRPVGTVYEVSTYETRTVRTGSYQTTEYCR